MGSGRSGLYSGTRGRQKQASKKSCADKAYFQKKQRTSYRQFKKQENFARLDK